MLTGVEQEARNGEGGGEPTVETPGAGKPPGHTGLVGAGSSRVGISGAMRARDVSRLRPEDLAEAERELRIRHAAPNSAQPTGTSTPSAQPDQPAKPGPPVPAPPPRRDHHAGGS
jgi:hypothetical protein